MKKSGIATLLAAAWLFGITLCGSSASAQTVPPPPLWVGVWYGNSGNPSDWYKFNDAVISTGAHRLHNIGITGKGLTTAVIDDGFNIGHDIYGPESYRIIYRDFGYEEPNDSFHGAHVAGIVLSMAPDSHLWLANIPEPEEDKDSGLDLYNDNDVARGCFVKLF